MMTESSIALPYAADNHAITKMALAILQRLNVLYARQDFRIIV